MKRFILIGIALGLSTVSLSAQNRTFNVANIPSGLLEGAHSVIREESIHFDVSDIDAASLDVHQVITVLDGEGSGQLEFVHFSSAFKRLVNAEIRVFDATGKELNYYKMKELNSESIGEGLVPDGKAYFFKVAAPSYPITVEYNYTIKYKGTLSYPDYRIQDPAQAVESSECVTTVPLTLGIRYENQNIALLPEVTSTDSKKTYKWSVQNLKAVPDEVGSSDEGADYPMVLLAPNKFSMDGYEGDLTSWKSFGNWYENLSSGAHDLSDTTKSTLRKMVAGITDKKAKIRILYQYLQRNFRYVSIQLGIGGFRPMSASYVDDKKYGDCKALCNYMQTCLAAVGIPSYQALVNAGYNSKPVDPDFPVNGFDHVILCVPMKKDSVWLECTSNITDFNQLGDFTEDRYALLITPAGGVLVHTPKSSAAENTFRSFTKVSLSDDGSGSIESSIHTAGEYRELMIQYVIGEGKDDQKKFLIRALGYGQPDNFELTLPQANDSTSLDLSLNQDKIPEFTAGNKMFLNPRLYKIWNGVLPDDTARTTPFYFEFPFEKSDTTVYQLPPDYTIETLPEPRSDSFKLGSYFTTYTYDSTKNSITTTSRLVLKTHVVEPKEFADVRKFFSDVIEEFTEKIVIKQKDS